MADIFHGSDQVEGGGTLADIVRGAGLSVIEIANDPVRIDRLLANRELLQRLLGTIAEAMSYVEGARA